MARSSVSASVTSAPTPALSACARARLAARAMWSSPRMGPRCSKRHVAGMAGLAPVFTRSDGQLWGALVQIVGTRKHSLLRHADFRPEAPRSRLQVPLGLGRPDVLV